MADKNNAPENGEDNKKKSKKKEDKKLKKNGDPNAPEEEEDDESGALSVVLVTIFIVLIWLAILALLVKLDVGGFGSGVLTPVLKDVPVVNKILPGYGVSENGIEGEESETAGYEDLDQAVARIKELENQISDAQKISNQQNQTIQDLQAEIARLRTFENNQVEFEKIKDEFYREVVFNDNAPDVSEYTKYYEQIDPTNAQILYKEAVKKEAADQELKDYAKAYSSMKAKEAAGIFDKMTNNLTLVAKILENMGTDARGSILGAMDAEVAAQVTKIMEPDTSSGTTGSSSGVPLTSAATTSGNSAN